MVFSPFPSGLQNNVLSKADSYITKLRSNHLPIVLVRLVWSKPKQKIKLFFKIPKKNTSYETRKNV